MKILQEKHVGLAHSRYDVKFTKYDVYLNPPYIKGLAPFCRGISTPDGDLYVVDDGLNIIHMDLVDWINKNTSNSIRGNYYAEAIEQGYLPWQKFGRTNKMYLGESVLDDVVFNQKENIKKIIEKLSAKNPKTEFYPWRIDN